MLPTSHSETHVLISICTPENAYPRFHDAILSTKYFDDETELAYYGYRYYSPELGRWMSRDSIAEQGGINLYAFLLNDPANDVDRYGNLGAKRTTYVQGASPGTPDGNVGYAFKSEYYTSGSEEQHVLAKINIFFWWIEKGDCSTWYSDSFTFQEWWRLLDGDQLLSDVHGLVPGEGDEICYLIEVATVTYGLSTISNRANHPFGVANTGDWSNGGSSDRFYDSHTPPQLNPSWPVKSGVSFGGNTRIWQATYQYEASADKCCCGFDGDKDEISLVGIPFGR